MVRVLNMGLPDPIFELMTTISYTRGVSNQATQTGLVSAKSSPTPSFRLGINVSSFTNQIF